MLLLVPASYAQFQDDAVVDYNMRYVVPGVADTLQPWYGVTGGGIRTVRWADDIDGDGKQEILATDYGNGGRVHMLEMNASGQLEVVWSSPAYSDQGYITSPRWVRTGDLDGDGTQEIIFPRAGDSRVEVWENAGDNNFGDEPAFTMIDSSFAPQGVGIVRLNREVGEVYDFDGDGKDEMTCVVYDNMVYVFGVSGSFPGFATWQLEGQGEFDQGGRIGSGSLWHGVPADIDGDGTMEIVNHFWNFYGFYHIEVTGVDTYEYPEIGTEGGYYEFTPSADGVAYMGIQPVDVDGDGSDEIGGIEYGNGYVVSLIDHTSDETGLNIWDSTDYAVIGEDLWELAGHEGGSFWGIGAYDFNGDGKEVLLVGGAVSYDVVGLEYVGSDDNLLDPANYEKSIWFKSAEGLDGQYANIFIDTDSLGVVDTSYSELPFVSKMHAGSDLNGNGLPEVVLAYQGVTDSVTTHYRHWQPDSAVAGAGDWVTDSTTKEIAYPLVIKVVEYDDGTGLRDLGLDVITPDDYVIEQNFPNPFNPSTTVRFSIPTNKNISLNVYDVNGQLVKRLIDNQTMRQGSYEYVWDGTNAAGSKVASGTYFCRLEWGNFAKSIKMLLVK